MKSTVKEERLNIRATPEIKALIERAAMLSHLSITDFVLATVRKAADRVIAESETMVLNKEERDRLLEMLDNPPPPSEELKAAALRQREYLRL